MIADPSGNSFEKILIMWGIGAPIVTGIAGYFGRRLHIRYQINQQNISSIRNEFINAFIPIIASIQNANVKYFSCRQVEIILEERKITHKKAIAKFRNTLSSKQKIIFDKVWINFSCEDYKEKNEPPYYNYLDDISGSDLKETVLKNIYALLKFAKYK